MLIQRGDGTVVALVPGRTMADGHSHTIEKYGKFAYSSKFGFSIARSNVTLAENAPDSMLAFQVYGYFFVKNTIEKDYVIGENGLCVRWSPMEGTDTSAPTGSPARWSVPPMTAALLSVRMAESGSPKRLPKIPQRFGMRAASAWCALYRAGAGRTS